MKQQPRSLSEKIKSQLCYALPLWFVELTTNWLPENSLTCRLRGELYRMFLATCGKRFAIGRDCQLNFPERLTVGNECYIARNAWIQSLGKVVLEDQVVCGPYVVIASTNHGFANGSTVGAGTYPEPIKVGRGTWVGARAIITAGVTIGKGNLIAAGAVVTRDTPDNVVVGGVPARVLRSLKDTVDSVEDSTNTRAA